MSNRQPNPEGRLTVGVDIGGTNVRAGLVDEQGNIVSEARRPTRALEGLEISLGMVKEAIREAMDKSKAQPSDIVGIGMGIPGIHRSEEGICVFSPNFKGWDNAQIAKPIADEFDLATYMQNDVATATLGEHQYGAGRGCQQVVMITLGTGIGGGAIVDGQLRLGATERFAEVGHMMILAGGPKCGCGNHGCWEALAGRDAIIERAMCLIQEGKKTSLIAAVKGNLDEITPALICQEAEKGDPVARRVIEETGMYVGLGIYNLMVLFDPEVVIVGGGIAQAGPILFDPIERTVRARSHMVSPEAKICPADLGDDAGIIGATVLVRQHLEEGRE